VPLTFSDDTLDRVKPLSGVSVESTVKHNKTKFDEALLFTHRGLSGPSILQISSYWREGDEITVDLARGQKITEKLKSLRGEAGKQSTTNVLARLIPAKLAQMIIEQTGFSGNLADQSNAKLDQIGQLTNAWTIKPAGSEGYRTAEVTLGGVDTSALDAKTMEAKNQKGLYFIGEVVDITGWLGGYNFQWAWSSGWVCGQVC
jgi:predicted Rossmann fold flavoprotein